MILAGAMNEDLEDLKLWLESNKLSLNVLKTKGMLMGARIPLKS